MVLLGGVGFVVINKAKQSVADLPVFGTVPAFQFVSHHGEPFGLEELKGKISLVDFIFTRCLGPCPIMAGHMGELYRKFEGYSEIQFVSISVEPSYDTLEALREYADLQGVTDNRWLFLRGEISEVAELCETGFMLAADNLPGMHSTKFILVDPNGSIRGYYGGTDPASMTVLQTHMSQLALQFR